MQIEKWSLAESAPLADLYNAHAVEVPYEHPVSPENLVLSITRPTPGLREEALWVAVEAGQPKGYVHVGVVAEGESPATTGLIRFLAFPRSNRRMGQALLDQAHAYLGDRGVANYRAFGYRFGYPCTWFDQLKSPWEHLYALLGNNGYGVEGQWALVAVWPDFQVLAPALPDGLEVRVDDTPIFPHLTSYGDLPTVVVRLFRDGQQVGGNETRPDYLPQWEQCPQDMCYTTGMGVNEAERGRGLGRYLMERSLFEMQRLGCRHAILDVDPTNFPALALYASMGYRTVYRVGQMSKGTE